MLFMNSFFIINEFEQAIVLQFGKPMGDSKRLMSMDRTERHGFKSTVNFKDGILKTIEWYLESISE